MGPCDAWKPMAHGAWSRMLDQHQVDAVQAGPACWNLSRSCSLSSTPQLTLHLFAAVKVDGWPWDKPEVRAETRGRGRGGQQEGSGGAGDAQGVMCNEVFRQESWPLVASSSILGQCLGLDWPRVVAGSVKGRSTGWA
jgi:hypothetical protein